MSKFAGVERGARILIVDDNPDVHVAFRSILDPKELDPQHARVKELEQILFDEKPTDAAGARPPSYLVDSAYQGEEAIAMVKAAGDHPYLLAFVDVRMPPGLDGIQTVKRLWAFEPGLYVVICTAYSDYSFDELQRELGDVPNYLILKKPFEAVEVRQMAATITHANEVTERVKEGLEEMVRSLSALHAQLDFVLGAVDYPALLLDEQGLVSRVNEGAAKALGLDAAELFGTDGRRWFGLDPAVPEANRWVKTVLSGRGAAEGSIEMSVTPLSSGAEHGGGALIKFRRPPG